MKTRLAITVGIGMVATGAIWLSMARLSMAAVAGPQTETPDAAVTPSGAATSAVVVASSPDSDPEAQAPRDAYARAKARLDEKIKARRDADQTNKSTKLTAELAIVDELKQRLETELRADATSSVPPTTAQTQAPAGIPIPAVESASPAPPVAVVPVPAVAVAPAAVVAEPKAQVPDTEASRACAAVDTAATVTCEGCPRQVADAGKIAVVESVATESAAVGEKKPGLVARILGRGAKTEPGAGAVVSVTAAVEVVSVPVVVVEKPAAKPEVAPTKVVETPAAEPVATAVAGDVRGKVDGLMAAVDRTATAPQVEIDTVLGVRADFQPTKVAEAVVAAGPVGYKGAWHDGTMSGYGTFTFVDGRKYTGEWVEGAMSGQGELTVPGKWKYAGEWKAGKVQGQGAFTSAEGWKYTGQWVKGKRAGQGTLTCTDGWEYVGTWAEGVMTGQGTLTTADGGKYLGQFSAGKRSGMGAMTYANGWSYEGQWAGDTMQGQGQLRHPDGWTYSGDWKAGKRSGSGVMTYADGWRYEGEWSDDKMSGRGKLVLPKGWTYEGEWKAGKMDGNGEAILRSQTSSAVK